MIPESFATGSSRAFDSDYRLTRVAAVFFTAICTLATVLVLAVLALPGAERTGGRIDVIDMAEPPVTVPGDPNGRRTAKAG